jgi:UDP-apiose/xylose synthase
VLLGCGGFIGSHLLDRLLEDPNVSVEGWDVSAVKIDRHLDDARLSFHRASIADASTGIALGRAIGNADVVINLAAVCNPSEYNTRPVHVIRSNFLDVFPIAEACAREATWFMHFSTSEVYGRTLASYVSPGAYEDGRLYEFEEDATPFVMGPIHNQRWTYACAKQLFERLVFGLHKETGMPYTIVRPMNVFGPRMDYIHGRDGTGVPRVLACFMGALLDGTPLRVVDGGKTRRTIVSIHDTVEAVMLMLTNPSRAQNQIFNIGNRQNEVTVLELADLIRHTYASVMGDSSYDEHPIEFVHSNDFYGEGYEDCDRRMPKLDKARQLLGWEPRVPLADLLRDTIADYQAHYSRAAEGHRVVAERRVGA